MQFQEAYIKAIRSVKQVANVIAESGHTASYLSDETIHGVMLQNNNDGKRSIEINVCYYDKEVKNTKITVTWEK